tara:strand:+ start:3344 stop:3595 length:252 start_codon:yes stop_codon:yes gene_type:complete
MTNRFGRVNRVEKGISYKCKKCSKRWNLNSIVRIKGQVHLIFNPNLRLFRRKSCYCSCGTAFEFPSIHVDMVNKKREKQGLIQ